MAKVDGTLHSLIQGVSQQDFAVMLPTQCRLQENMSSNPVEGLSRRAPTDFLASLGNFPIAPQFYQFSTQGTDYILATAAGAVKVFRLADGSTLPINLGAGAASYLSIGKLCFTTLKGEVYIGNTTATVSMLPDVKQYAPKSSIIHLNGGQYGRDYIATVTWPGGTETFHYLTPNGSTATDTPKVASTYIANQLLTSFNANGALTGTFNIQQKDDVLLISSNSGTVDFSVTIDDGAGNSVAFATNNTTVDAGDLPRYAPAGYFCSITGTGTADQDDYFLEFTPNDGTLNIGSDFGKDGTWKETVLKDIPYKLDHTTMPFIMSYDPSTGGFSIDAGEWKDREVGDDVNTNEDPSFVGLTIAFMSAFQGRLMFLSGPNVIMSRTDKPLNFWRTTATQLLDADPIDISSTAENVNNMLSATPFDRDMIIFADRKEKQGGAQFIVFGRNAITPQNCSLVLTTTYEADLNAVPVAAGKNIFFAIKHGSFTGIREFFTEVAADSNDSRPITEHVSKYIEGNVNTMSSSINFNLLLVGATKDAHDLYAYEYIWEDQKKAQSSWSKWTFDNPIYFHCILDGVAFLISQVGTAYLLESMDLDVQIDDGMPYQVKLDSRAFTPSVHTTMSNPLPVMPDMADMIFVQGVGCPHPGMRAEVLSHTDSTITFMHDMLGGTIISGVKFLSRYKPNMPFVRDRDNVALTNGRLIIKKFDVNYKNTGFIGSIVSSKYMADRVLTFTGRIVDDVNTTIGNPVVISGLLGIPFRQNVDIAELEIFSDSHLPMTITNIPWEGQYTSTGKHISTGA